MYKWECSNYFLKYYIDVVIMLNNHYTNSLSHNNFLLRVEQS